MALPASAQVGDEHFLLAPVESTNHEYVWASGMRITSEVIGYRSVLEFDISFPEGNKACKLAAYNQKIDKTDGKASHVSVYSVVDGKWSCKLEGSTPFVSNLDCGETYHIKLAVDFETQKQYMSISKDGTVLGYVHGADLYQEVTGERVTMSYRWFGDFTTNNSGGTGDWNSEEITPANVKIIRDASYALGTPSITFEDGKVSASVMTYHNTLEAVDSPVLMLCLYDSSNMLINVTAAQNSFLEKASPLPFGEELTASISTSLVSGMKAKAMVINKTSGRLLYGGVAESTYSE